MVTTMPVTHHNLQPPKPTRRGGRGTNLLLRRPGRLSRASRSSCWTPSSEMWAAQASSSAVSCAKDGKICCRTGTPRRRNTCALNWHVWDGYRFSAGSGKMAALGMNPLAGQQQPEDISQFFNGPGRMDAPGMKPPAGQQQEEDISQFFNGPGRMDAPGMNPPAGQQQEEAISQFFNGPGRMDAPGMNTPAGQQQEEDISGSSMGQGEWMSLG